MHTAMHPSSLAGHSAPPTRKEVHVALEARAATWEYSPGKSIEGWSYNGQFPGPTIEACVGDTLVVHFTNGLDEPTTVHWHGLRLTPDMDGTDDVHPAIQPGESFEYRFPLPDAGTFWYHSHVNETVQMERGLYGALIVRGDRVVVDAERVLELDDLLLDERGELASFTGEQQRHDGRIGNVRLVNGRAEPELTMRAGQVERWRVVNASSARYINLSIGVRPFQLIATDGGLIESAVTMSELLLTPGERADILVGPFAEGEILFLDSLGASRIAGESDAERFATLRVEAPAPSRAHVPARLREIERLDARGIAPNHTVHFQRTPATRRAIDWLINEETHHHAPSVVVGELQVWDIVNETAIDHPFHLHGFFFQVVSVDGVAPPFIAWRDTVNVRAGETVCIAWMPDDRPGAWMYHCHILEHHAAGMMAHFQVVRPGEPERQVRHMSSHHAAH